MGAGSLKSARFRESSPTARASRRRSPRLRRLPCACLPTKLRKKNRTDPSTSPSPAALEPLAEYKSPQSLQCLLRSGWSVKEQKGSSHVQLTHPTKGRFTWAFHDSEGIGPRMLARIAK